WVDQALAANAQAVQDAIANPKKIKAARGFLTGQVMKLSGGKADPKIVGELIEKKLAEKTGGNH
ncbi:MAG TPA: Asp-tRNA(Asn)/Glu-tRNA(Gln) amidotransferase GatCAB subunit B, partial [Phycisphaerae bacterium]|nr:Asp-tRNA(Asn)/Glu-tRNA(Gln) amidotransferase GatCAB subunit B [Phycisphaerae bacterium]